MGYGMHSLSSVHLVCEDATWYKEFPIFCGKTSPSDVGLMCYRSLRWGYHHHTPGYGVVMNTETWIIFGLLTVTVVLFLSDRIRLDLVALLALLSLVLTRMLTPAEALAGFGDPLLLTIAGLFVVGAGLLQTGVADAVGQRLKLIAGNTERRVIVVTMLLVALFSAVMSSTGTVAVFLPVVVSLAAGIGLSRARLLIPLAYASLLGGMLTLIGTPPNLVVSEALVTAGLQPFTFFDFTPVGVVMLLIGIAFMSFLGPRLLPDRDPPLVSPSTAMTTLLPATNFRGAYRACAFVSPHPSLGDHSPMLACGPDTRGRRRPPAAKFPLSPCGRGARGEGV